MLIKSGAPDGSRTRTFDPFKGPASAGWATGAAGSLKVVRGFAYRDPLKTPARLNAFRYYGHLRNGPTAVIPNTAS